MRRGVYPGSFNPPTRAHVAIAAAAIEQCQLDRLTLVVSRLAFDKEAPPGPPLADRVAVIEASFRHLGAVHVAVTDARLIADIAAGFDVVVMGRDKWDQLWDMRYYRSVSERDSLLDTLPEVAVAPRDTVEGSGTRSSSVPDPRPESVLDLDGSWATVSSTRARTVDSSLMTPEALASGWWTEPPPSAPRHRER